VSKGDHRVPSATSVKIGQNQTKSDKIRQNQTKSDKIGLDDHAYWKPAGILAHKARIHVPVSANAHGRYFMGDWHRFLLGCTSPCSRDRKKILLLEQSNCESDRESDGDAGTDIVKTRDLFSEVFTCSALEPGAAPVGH
jgi:hypothetical protein